MRPQRQHAVNGTRGRWRVKCCQDKVPAVRRANGRQRGFLVANLADHDDIRSLPEDIAQQLREVQAEFRIHLRLPNAIDRILDGIFQRVDLACPVVQVL